MQLLGKRAFLKATLGRVEFGFRLVESLLVQSDLLGLCFVRQRSLVPLRHKIEMLHRLGAMHDPSQ